MKLLEMHLKEMEEELIGEQRPNDVEPVAHDGLLPVDECAAFELPRTSIHPISASPSFEDSVDDVWNAIRSRPKKT